MNDIFSRNFEEPTDLKTTVTRAVTEVVVVVEKNKGRCDDGILELSTELQGDE
jgi:hypothetical protein